MLPAVPDQIDATEQLAPVGETLYEITERARDANRPDGTPFSPTASPTYRKAIFVIGAPRSGTTWLQQMMAVHPDVATSGESHLFCEGFDRLIQNHEEPDPFLRPYQHLATWVSRARLVELLRGVHDELFDSMRRLVRPSASRVLDKTPNHRQHASLLHEVYPDAAYVHIIRDARDVAGSARSLWSFNPEYRHLEDGARVWLDSVTDTRQHLSSGWYHEVRYEDLMTDPTASLAAIWTALDLPAPPDLVEAAAAFARAPINVRPSDDRVGIRKWADQGSAAEQRVIDVAGPLLADLGYITASEAARGRGRPSRLLDQARRTAVDITITSRRQRERRGARRLRVIGQSLATALEQGDEPRLAQLLSTDVEADGLPAEPTEAGIAQRMAALGRGAVVVSMESDQLAIATQLVLPDGARVLLRCWVQGDLIRRVALSPRRS